MLPSFELPGQNPRIGHKRTATDQDARCSEHRNIRSECARKGQAKGAKMLFEGAHPELIWTAALG